MKKLIGIIIGVCMLFSYTTSFALKPVTITLDCVPVQFEQEPVILNDRTFVPVRPIFEAMGATVKWDSETRTVTSTLGEKTAVFTIDSNVAKVNGFPKQLDAAPQIIGSSTMVPARAVSEVFDCTVDWDGAARRVLIETYEFSERVKKAKKHNSIEKITSGESSAYSVFSVMYLDGYTVKKDIPDGTKIEFSYDMDDAHANLSIRSDIYFGTEPVYSDEYVKSIAEDMVSVVAGTLVSYGSVTINETEFVKIAYTAPRTVSGITDENSDITVYMAVKDGVVYTITMSVYGEVEKHIYSDFYYSVNSIIIP